MRPQESDLSDCDIISQLKLEKIFDMPYVFCIIYNCCVYKRSVLGFKFGKYSVSRQVLSTKICDAKMYVWKTCNLKLKMENIPDRAVLYKRCVTDLIKEFRDIRRLEQPLMPKILLFKKVTIILKGQSPNHE